MKFCKQYALKQHKVIKLLPRKLQKQYKKLAYKNPDWHIKFLLMCQWRILLKTKKKPCSEGNAR